MVAPIQIEIVNCPHARGGEPSRLPSEIFAVHIVPTHVGVNRVQRAEEVRRMELSPRTWG